MPKSNDKKSRSSNPDQTEGSKLASKLRDKANGLTPEQKAKYFRKGMSIIYGGRGAKETVRH